MLTVTYSQCLADPTYCDDGKKGGAELIKTLGVKANEPIPLKAAYPYITLREALWCLRVVRKSQMNEARVAAWVFIAACLSMFPQIESEEVSSYIADKRDGKRVDTHRQLELCDKFTDLERTDKLYKLVRIAVCDRNPSQIAIDVLEETIKQGVIYYHDRNIEEDLRGVFLELING